MPSATLSSTTTARPFLKWAGGKTQLLEQLRAHYPPELARGAITRYVEPFLGGGAVFLDVMQRGNAQEAYLFDVNPELVVAYTAVQRDPEGLIDRLTACRELYLEQDGEGRALFFYARRAHYNEQKATVDFRAFSPAWVERAADLIFLNKTCYNGLFRVNAAGQFNVPAGRYAQPEIFDAANIRAVSQLLQRATIGCGSFATCRPVVDQHTFVYFDPPYRPLSRTANFTSYAADRFGDDEQRRLAALFAQLDAETGARLMLSNSDPKNIDPHDNFFDDLYAAFPIRRLAASRMINSVVASRGKITEILVTNY
jgi:DNA adenine methylase